VEEIVAGAAAPNGGFRAWLAPAAMSLAVLATATSIDRRHRERRPVMIALGLSSYSLYMTHIFVQTLFGGVEGGGAVERLGVGSAPGAVQAAFVVVVIAACVAVGHACYLVVEEPSRVWLRRRLVPGTSATPVEAQSG
jgi:peptidoglycan/LPS O-acetylase OafA/YrhL